MAGREKGGPEEVTPRIIRPNEFLAKPMTVDEAVMQMDLMNNDFLVFTNAASREMNVVYRRKDGHYGLIEAPTGKEPNGASPRSPSSLRSSESRRKWAATAHS